MEEKKEGKENEKCSTMPDVLIKGYKILRTVSVGQDFGVDPKSLQRCAPQSRINKGFPSGKPLF